MATDEWMIDEANTCDSRMFNMLEKETYLEN